MGSFYGGGGLNESLDTATAERFSTHAADVSIHVTAEEKQKWNNKTQIELDTQNHSMIITTGE